MTDDTCREIRELLAAFHDDELPCDRSREIQDHLDRCDGCRGFSRLEQEFTRSLRERLPRAEVPPGLFDRVRARLDEEDAPAAEAPSRAGAKAGRRTWARLPGAGIGLLAAALAVALVAPAVAPWLGGSLRPMADWLQGVQSLHGVLICFECERHGVPLEAQQRCRAPGHQTGVKCPETGLWHLVASDASVPFTSHPEMRGRSVELEGRLLEDIRYIDVRAMTIASGT